MAANLAELLAENNIRKAKISPGTTSHVRCPICDGGKTHEDSLSVTIDADGEGAAWVCHRGSCPSAPGGARLRTSAPVQPKRIVKAPPVHSGDLTSNRPDWLYDWFAERKIGARVVLQFGIYAASRWFNDQLGECPAIVFPFVWKGEVVNRKYRPRGQKQPQAQEKDAAQTIFNIDALGDDPEEIIWVEGEPDVMALAECGLNHGVTLKDGAPSQVNAANQARFEALTTHEKILERARKIILAGDNDAPGLALREELARRLGRHRCWLVTWPDGCKDAGAVLCQHGPDAVLEAIQAAEPYPIEGMRRIKRGILAKLRAMPAPGVMTTGTTASNAVLKLPMEGRLIVVTGWPNHGKTTWTRFVMVHTAKEHSRRWVVFSPESQPWEQFAAECAETYVGQPFYGLDRIPGMSDGDIAEAEAFLADRVVMLVYDAEDEAPTLDWLLERARACVLREGTTDFLFDPWNEISQERGAMSETDFIGRCLQRLRAFGQRHGVNMWIVAHPAKPPPLRPKEVRPPPGPYDIAGSAHWANRPDIGLTIHNPQPGLTELHVWKSKNKRWGMRGTVATMELDRLCGRYSTPPSSNDAAVEMGDDLLRGNWR